MPTKYNFESIFEKNLFQSTKFNELQFISFQIFSSKVNVEILLVAMQMPRESKVKHLAIKTVPCVNFELTLHDKYI